jgi:hypothetical protein
MMSTCNLLTSRLSTGTPRPIVSSRIGLFVCMFGHNYFGYHVGPDFNVGLAVVVRVMCLALIRVLPLGTQIIFFLLMKARNDLILAGLGY